MYIVEFHLHKNAFYYNLKIRLFFAYLFIFKQRCKKLIKQCSMDNLVQINSNKTFQKPNPKTSNLII